jgi:hypothetical protein
MQSRALCGQLQQQQLQPHPQQQLSRHHLQQQQHLRRPVAPRQQQQHPARSPVAAAAKKRSSPVATGLVSVLQDELKIEKERYRTPEAVLEGPPGGYELEDRPNCTVLLLTRSFDAEDVVVEVDIDAQEAEEEGLEGGGDPDDEEGPDADDAGLPPVTFTVNISKGERIMAFACETDGEEVAINHVSLSDAPEAEDEDDLGDFAPYTGPVFGELDDTLQSAFRDYLEERGINGEFGSYLMELVHDKLEVEYMNWLQRAREFISSS